MSEMIERVAKAIFASYGSTSVSSVEPPWSVCYPQARAAIEAMREPTEKMIEDAYYSAMAEKAKDVWQDMIDSALGLPRSP